MKIGEPGVYSISDEDYHADPCVTPSLSSSVAKVLLDQTPLHAFMQHPRLNPAYVPANKKQFDIGTAAHDLILRGDECLCVIDADDFRTKAAREARDAAYAKGKTPLLQKDWERVQGMARAVQAQLGCHREARGAYQKGKPEQTVIWREGAVWCRIKLDWLPDDGASFYDLKTTTDANPNAWQRRLFENGADVQSGLYRRGIKAVLGVQNPRFRFIVVENELPHALSVVELDPGALDLADRKADEAIRLWGECMKNKTWPGYPPMVHHVSPPAWELARWESRGIQREMADHFADYFGI